MPSLRITHFSGIAPEVPARLAAKGVAQKAHNCLLWDGVLRPLAEWRPIYGINYENAFSIFLSADNKIISSSPLRQATALNGDNYSPDTVIGLTFTPYGVLDANINYANRTTTANGLPVGIQKPSLSSVVLNYARQYKSDKAVSRAYAVSGLQVRGNYVVESQLTLFPSQDPRSLVYEGDAAVLACVVTSPSVPYVGWRIYRAISGFDDASSPNNELDTKWLMVAESKTITALNFVDDGAATNDPLDLYLGNRLYPPPALFFSQLQVLEGGWVVAATLDGYVAVSDRNLLHAWPTENLQQLPGENITAMKASMDTVFIGTKNAPYMMAVSANEDNPTQINVTPYLEKYECLTDTMASTPNGVIYASPSGLINLSRQGMNKLTAGIANGVEPILKIKSDIDLLDSDTLEVTTSKFIFDMKFEHTTYGAYYHGSYFGFCSLDTGHKEIVTGDGDPYEGAELYVSKGYIFDTGSDLDGSRPSNRLVTFDVPAGVRAHIAGGSGLYVLSSEGIFRMAFPDSKDKAYALAPKYCYDWKSKKFVFPGEMCFAAAKVVHDCDGDVKLSIYADCECVYEVSVKDCQPFLLPPGIVGTTFEVELTGTASVYEVHLASSLRELLEDE